MCPTQPYSLLMQNIFIYLSIILPQSILVILGAFRQSLFDVLTYQHRFVLSFAYIFFSSLQPPCVARYAFKPFVVGRVALENHFAILLVYQVSFFKFSFSSMTIRYRLTFNKWSCYRSFETHRRHELQTRASRLPLSDATMKQQVMKTTLLKNANVSFLQLRSP